MNKFTKDNYLTSYNFARRADVVFSEVLSTSQFQKINNPNLKINFKNLDITSYKLKGFKLSQGDIIFSNSAAIKNLFRYLKDVNESFNLQLITHQADYPIEKGLFLKRPKCISNWYAINVNHSDKNLIPIPLGIANNYSTKNLVISDFIKEQSVHNDKKVNKLYINLVKSTNYQERGNFPESLFNSDWVVHKEPTLTLNDYLNDLQKYKFILCPWGNGYDTHRLWETLYSGSVPVVRYHPTYSNLSGLPIIFYNDIKELSLKFLNEALLNLNSNNLEKLSTEYWFDVMKSQQKKGSRSIEIEEKIFYEKYTTITGKIRNKYLSYKKKILFYKKQIFKALSKI